MRPFKVIVAGPGKAEKTAFIKGICDITVVSAGRSKSDGLQHGKGEKPVAMDVGRINVSKDMALYLFGCEARQRFDLLADTFAEGLLGLLVVISDDDHESLAEAGGVLAYFGKYGDIPCVVAANGLNKKAKAELRKGLEVGEDVPIVFCDVSDRSSSRGALTELLKLSRASISKEAS